MSVIRKLVIFGDSISTPLIGDGGYEALLCRLLQPNELYNFAVPQSGASSVTPDHVMHILNLQSDACAGADVVILWHGTNDWYWGASVGKCGSRDGTTYIGAMELAIDRIRRYAPEALVITATPLYRHQAPDGSQISGDAWFIPNKAGATLADYDRALREVARAYSVPLVEMRVLTGFCEQNSERFLPDNVHPGTEGCDMIARIFAGQIEGLMSYRKGMENHENVSDAREGRR